MALQMKHLAPKQTQDQKAFVPKGSRNYEQKHLQIIQTKRAAEEPVFSLVKKQKDNRPQPSKGDVSPQQFPVLPLTS